MRPTPPGSPAPDTSQDDRLIGDVAPSAFDASAVMDVLRTAIDRYTTGDGSEQGAWVDEHAGANDTDPLAGTGRHVPATGYAPDRRRLAAAVVVLSLLAGGLGYTWLRAGGSENVKTNTVSTLQGLAVTTLTRPSTSAAPLPPPTEAASTTAPVVAPSRPTTTVHRAGTTPAPPELTTETATTEPETTTTEPTTTTTSLLPPPDPDCSVIPPPTECAPPVP